MSKSSDLITAPERIFLCDVAKRAKQSSNNRLFRLMGTIVEILPQQHVSSSENQLLSFIMDDGSGTVAVFTRRRLDTCSSSIAKVPLQKNVPQHFLIQSDQIQYNKDVSSPSPTSRSFLPSIPVLKLGLTVDCIGVFHVASGDAPSDDQGANGVADGNQSSNEIIWLAASAVSVVTNPQEVSLRQIELSSVNDESSQHNKQMNLTLDRRTPVDNCLPKNRIMVSKNLSLKLNSVICKGDRLQQQEPQLVFTPDDAFRYINYSKDDGGISASDLALIVGATKMKDKMMVKAAVEHLQNVGMIYMKQGKYYPL